MGLSLTGAAACTTPGGGPTGAGPAPVSSAAPAATQGQDAPAVVPPMGVTYSPYPEQNFPDQVFFGDTHLHTAFSPDAGLIGATLTPDDAFRFARGETVISSTGIPARLGRPLDFLVVSDHAENLGLPTAVANRDTELLATEFGREIANDHGAGHAREQIRGL